MSPIEMTDVLREIKCLDYAFDIYAGDGYHYLQGSYPEPDVETGMPSTQRTRKWLLSKYMTKSELVQTALKCALTSAEHRIREHFLYRGELIYGPHFDVEALWQLAHAKHLDVREPPKETAHNESQ